MSSLCYELQDAENMSFQRRAVRRQESMFSGAVHYGSCFMNRLP